MTRRVAPDDPLIKALDGIHFWDERSKGGACYEDERKKARTWFLRTLRKSGLTIKETMP